MFRLLSAFVVAALFTAFAVNRPANGENGDSAVPSINRAVVTTESAARPLSLDDYAGVYRTADGVTFVVVRDAESLKIELPETLALPIRAAGSGFVLDASFLRIEFEPEGGNARMVLVRAFEEPIVATRVTLPRGAVTIHDI